MQVRTFGSKLVGEIQVLGGAPMSFRGEWQKPLISGPMNAKQDKTAVAGGQFG